MDDPYLTSCVNACLNYLGENILMRILFCLRLFFIYLFIIFNNFPFDNSQDVSFPLIRYDILFC